MKYWVLLDGTIDVMLKEDQYKFVAGDKSYIHKFFPICEHCGEFIESTIFGIVDMNGNKTDLCFSCSINGKHFKTHKAISLKIIILIQMELNV